MNRLVVREESQIRTYQAGPHYTATITLGQQGFSFKNFLEDFEHDWNVKLESDWSEDDQTFTYLYSAQFGCKVYMTSASSSSQKHDLSIICDSDNQLFVTQYIVQILATAVKQQQVESLYAWGRNWKPSQYRELALFSKDENELPLLNVVGIGLYSLDGETLCGYTYGMEYFGKMNIEILNSVRNPSEIQLFLADVAHYIVSSKESIISEDTIGYMNEEKVTMDISEGVSVPGNTMKLKLDTRPLYSKYS